MHLSIPSLLPSLLLFATAVSSSSLTITIPPSNLLPNPNVLPAGTHATLTSLPASTASSQGQEQGGPLTAPLTHTATFVFRNLQPKPKAESYLLDIRSAEYVFAPYRVDVSADGAVMGVWETFRGNPWDNRGAEMFNFVVDGAAAGAGAGAGAGEKKNNKKDIDVIVEAKVLARRGFYEQRAQCESSPRPRSGVICDLFFGILTGCGVFFFFQFRHCRCSRTQ